MSRFTERRFDEDYYLDEDEGDYEDEFSESYGDEDDAVSGYKDREDDLYPGDDLEFADPGGRSALRAGVREFPCPTCGRENALTAKDVQLHYQCDRCADALEGLFGGEY